MHPKRKFPARFGFLALVFSLAAVTAVFLYSRGSGGDGAAAAGLDSESTAVTDSSSSGGDRETAMAVPVEVANYILQNATVDTEEGVDVHARVTGLIVKLNVEEGDLVARGAVLCRLEDDDFRLARDKAKVVYDKQQAEFRRLQDMHEKQLTSTKEFEEARFSLEQARIDWETAELNLKRTRITAPISGVVTDRHVRLGQLVGTANPLFRIVDIKEKVAVVHLPEREIGRVKKGQPAYLSSKNLQDKRFEARIKRLAPAVDAESGTFKVTVGVLDPENGLRPGMFVSVHIVTDTHRNALLIPKSALLYENGSPYAFFVEEDTLTRRVRLETGFSNERYIEVLSSVSDQDRVIVAGQNGLKDNDRIKVVAGLLQENEQIAGREAEEEDKI